MLYGGVSAAAPLLLLACQLPARSTRRTASTPRLKDEGRCLPPGAISSSAPVGSLRSRNHRVSARAAAATGSGGGGRVAGKGTAAAAAPGARVTLLLRCFAEPSVSVVVSPCSRQGARLHHAPCPPAACPSRSLTKASSPRAVLSSAVRIYTSNNKGFSFAVTEFCSFPPNIPPSGFSTGFAALRNDPRAPGASAAAPHHPVRAPAGEPRHHLVRSNRSLCFWGVAEPDVPRADKAPFGLKAPLHQCPVPRRGRRLLCCDEQSSQSVDTSGNAHASIALHCLLLWNCTKATMCFPRC